MTKVLVTEKIHPNGMKTLEDAGFEIVKSNIKGVNDPETIIEEFKDIDAALIRVAEVPKEAIEGAKNLKIISNHGVGLDNYPMEALKEKGIVLTMTPGANSLAVAEYVIAMMSSISLQLHQSEVRYAKEGWSARANCPLGYTMTGKTLGILGYGRIGRLIGDMCMKAFNMKVVVYDPYVPRNDERVTYYDDLDDLLKVADYITLHLMLTDETRHMISDHEFDLMKPNAIILNAARGPIIDEKALIRALDENKIWGAGLDVTEAEPLDPDSPLFKNDRVIVTPHFAVKTNECEMAVATEAAENLVRFFNGEEVQGRVRL